MKEITICICSVGGFSHPRTGFLNCQASVTGDLKRSTNGILIFVQVRFSSALLISMSYHLWEILLSYVEIFSRFPSSSQSKSVEIFSKSINQCSTSSLCSFIIELRWGTGCQNSHEFARNMTFFRQRSSQYVCFCLTNDSMLSTNFLFRVLFHGLLKHMK